MPKKSVLCSLLCILLAFVLIAGCGRGNKPQQSAGRDVPTTHINQSASRQASTTRTDQPASSKPALPAESHDASPDNILWDKYTAADGSFSFHFPEGWKVEVDESIVSIDNAKSDEQLLMTAVPFDKDKDPAALAADFISLLKQSNPNVQASNWQTDSNGANRVVFDLSDEIGGKKYNGLGIVIKDSQQALWLSYTAPASAYSSDRGFTLLQGFMESFSSGTESKAPNVNNDFGLEDKIDTNAKGFMFVLEFALGAPFTQSQEQVILDELKSGWRLLTEDELNDYDQYPLLVNAILSMNQKDLDELRGELEKVIREWLEESPDSDKAVRLIRDQMESRGREVIAGDPPLTEMSLTAYSEIIAYSRLLQQNSEAGPEEISPDSVKDIKQQVKDIWETFTVEERQQIATSPGLWICLRTLMSNGTEEEQDKIRNSLLELTPEPQPTNDSNESGTGRKPMSMAAHSSLMAIQQMTFNHYMWSHGFNYHPTFGKMW